MNFVRQQDGDLLFQQHALPACATDSSSDVSQLNAFFQPALSLSSGNVGLGLRRQRPRREVLSVIAEDDDMILFKAQLKKQTASQCLADLADSVSVNNYNTTSQDPCTMETEEALCAVSSSSFPSHTDSKAVTLTPGDAAAADDDWGYFSADSSLEVGSSPLYYSVKLGQRSRRRNPKYPRAGGRCSPNSPMPQPKHPQGAGLCLP